MDALSDVLDTLRFSGAVLLRAELTAPWAVAEPHPRELAAALSGHAPRQFVLFHVVVRGRCYLEFGGQAPQSLHAGEVAVISDTAHTLCDAPGRPGVPAMALLPDGRVPSAPPLIEHGCGGERTSMVCGDFQFEDATFNPLVSALPRVLRVRPPEAATGWMNNTLQYFVREAQSNRPGSASLLKRLTELLFVEVLRRYVEELPPDQIGWLAALGDPVVGRALELLHGDPGHPWTVAALARAAGVSRSGLAARFAKTLAQSPMQYLARWRIHLASRLLLEGEESVAAVVDRVGYTSEPAFNRAFKRLVGQPPATWVRSLRGTSGPSH